MTVNFINMLSLLAEKDPRRVYEDMLQSNADFREFIDKNKNKTRRELIESYNLDIIRE